MTTTTLTLGDFEFARYEIPESIPFGGEQRLNVHELVGGVRVVDVLGAVSVPIEWSGFFVGENGLSRARYLDTLRKAGRPLELAWSQLYYLVVIQSFHCDFKNIGRIPYRISCTVVKDLTAKAPNLLQPSISQLVAEDAATATTLTETVGDSKLSSLMGTLNSAIGKISDFAKATQSTLNSVLQPIAAVRAQVSILMASANGVIQNVVTVGGILPNNPIAQQANKLTGQINAMVQMPALLNLNTVLGRMQSNIGTVGSGTKQVTVAGGNAYAIAAKEYGDPMGYTAIMQANKLQDPQMTGVQTLTIPKFSNDTGGVVNA